MDKARQRKLDARKHRQEILSTMGTQIEEPAPIIAQDKQQLDADAAARIKRKKKKMKMLREKREREALEATRAPKINKPLMDSEPDTEVKKTKRGASKKTDKSKEKKK